MFRCTEREKVLNHTPYFIFTAINAKIACGMCSKKGLKLSHPVSKHCEMKEGLISRARMAITKSSMSRRLTSQIYELLFLSNWNSFPSRMNVLSTLFLVPQKSKANLFHLFFGGSCSTINRSGCRYDAMVGLKNRLKVHWTSWLTFVTRIPSMF